MTTATRERGPVAASYPPRLMRREQAARYLGMSPSKFDQLVKDGRITAPARIDGMALYDRHILDADADNLLHAPMATNSWD